MPLEEKKIFVKDPAQDMDIRDKNLHLAAKLSVAPLVTKKIVRIERIEIGASGWWVRYRVGTP